MNSIERNNADRILEFKLNSLLKELWFVVFASSFVVLVTAYLMIPFVNNIYLYIWVILTLLANSLRLILRTKFNKDPNPNFKKYLKCYTFFTVILGVSWGLISIFSINKLPSNLSVLYTAILLGMISGGAINNISIKGTALTFISSIGIPFMVKVGIEDPAYGVPFLSMISIYIFLFVRLIINFNRTSIDGFKLYLEKENLLKEVEKNFELERQLREEKLKSIESSKLASLGEMAAGVAHEINNPLTIVNGYLWQLKRKYQEDQDALRLIEESVKASKRIDAIIQSMKNLSRLKNPTELACIEFQEVIETVEPLIKLELRGAGVQLNWDIPSFRLKAHLSEISQVIYNIIHNAIQALNDFDGKRLVVIKYHDDADFQYITIIDSGKGIEKTIQDKVFEPFYTTKEVGKGTGLGLSLSKSIIESYRGRLIYSNENESKFEIILPKV